jgi:hypothetical protein
VNLDRLRQSDLRRLLDCVRECNAIREFETFEQFLIKLVIALDRLIPAAHVTYNEMYPEKPQSYNIASSAELSTLVAASLWQQHMNEHPVLIHVAQTGDSHTLRISDFWSQRELRNSGLFTATTRSKTHYAPPFLRLFPGLLDTDGTGTACSPIEN